MAIDLRIKTDTSDECDYIHVEDITTHAPARSSFGIALYCQSGTIGGSLSVDSALSDLSSSGDDNYAGEWYVSTANRMEYEIEMFCVELWVAGTYNPDVVVYYGGNFYVNDAVGTTTDVPGTGSDWLLLDGTETGGYDHFAAAVVAEPTTIVKDSDFTTISCARYELLKTDCHKYTLSDTLSSAVTATAIYIHDYLGALINTLEVPAAGGDVSFELDEDGVYVLTVGDETHVIYEWCDLRECVTKMVDYILCTADDPCTETCDAFTKTKIRSYRDELNLLLGLYYPMFGMIYTDKMKYVGVLSEIDDDRQLYIEKVGDMIAKMKVITERCGICEDTLGTSSCTC